MSFPSQKNIRLKNLNRQIQQLGIFLDFLPVDCIITGVHDQKNHFKRNINLETVISYHKGAESHHFLDDYEETT